MYSRSKTGDERGLTGFPNPEKKVGSFIIGRTFIFVYVVPAGYLR
jgi:hypothetical protein